jgi:methionyl-tRNA formyltransferase
MTRIFLAGSGTFGLNTAETLTAAGHVLVGCVSPAQGRTTSHDLLAGWANRTETPWHDVTVLRPEHVPDGTDLILAAHSHTFIGTRTRARAPLAIGYHPSLLPLHRGRDAVKWQTRLNERVTGGTLYHLTNRIDGGPIASQQYVITPEHLDARTLWRNHLAPLGLTLITELANLIQTAGPQAVPSKPQDDTLATWEPALDGKPLHRSELIELQTLTPAKEQRTWPTER